MSTAVPDRAFVYCVDADDRIVSVTPEWESFALENDASQLTSESVCGRPLAGFIANRETQHLYEMILEKVRREACTVVVPFRCDGPRIRRFMELTVSPGQNGQVEFEGRIRREEEREVVALFESPGDRDDGYVLVCSWCKRVEVGDEWVEVEEAVTRLDLFGATPLPKITHGMCPDCVGQFHQQFDSSV